MTEIVALDVMNQLVATGRIVNYAMLSDRNAWKSIDQIRIEPVDIAVVPTADVAAGAGLDHLRMIMTNEGFGERGRNGLIVAGWDIRFVVAECALAREAVECATVSELPIAETRRSVRGRIVRPEHYAALMLAADTQLDRFWVGMMIEEEEVDIAALDDVVSRHGLAADWRRRCEAEELPADWLQRRW